MTGCGTIADRVGRRRSYRVHAAAVFAAPSVDAGGGPGGLRGESRARALARAAAQAMGVKPLPPMNSVPASTLPSTAVSRSGTVLQMSGRDGAPTAAAAAAAASTSASGGEATPP